MLAARDVISNAIKNKLFSIFAHDLRSPFHAFLNLLRTVREELPTLERLEIQVMHGGNISVNSGEGAGTTVRFTLPSGDNADAAIENNNEG